MKKISLLCLLFILSINAQPVWEKLKGPMGCVVVALVTQGDTIIIGTGYSKGLIFFSTDQGNHWQEANIKSTSRFSDFVFSGEAFFAAKYYNYTAPNNGIYKSYDMVNWTQIYNSSLHIWSIGKDAFGGIYAGTDEGQILFSSDNGNSWTASIDVDGRNYNFILSEDSTLYVGGFQKILRKNPFSSWNILPIYSPIEDYIPFMDDNKNLYAHGNSVIYKSTNKGNSWTQLDTNGFFQNVYNTIARMIFNHRMLAGLLDETNFIGTGWGIAVSNDTGLTWNWSNNGLPPKFSEVFRLAKSGINTFAGTNAAGIFKSTDFGDSWFPVNNGIYAAITEDITFDKDSNLYTANWSNGIQKSTDRGNSWEVINNGLTNSYLYSIIADTNNNLMAGTNQGIFRSTDNGENWVQTADAGNNYAYQLFRDRANRIYALTHGTGLYRTTDLGYSWTSLNNAFVNPYLYCFAEDSSNYLYTGSAEGWIYRSINDGAAWIPVYHSTVPNAVVSGLSASPNGDIFANIYQVGVLRSTNHGQNWNIVKQETGPQYYYPPIAVNKQGEIYVTGSVDKLYHSTDNGQTWENITNNLNMVSILRIMFDKDDNIYLATDESVWRGDRIIPVELVSFTANVDINSVVLIWATATEKNNRGFDLERQVHSLQSSVGKWEMIGFVEGNGTTTERKEYSFIDRNVSAGTYSYRLKQIDFDGSFKYSKEVEVEINPKLEFSLEQNYPNPFNPETNINFTIPEESNINLKLYDITGREIKVLVNEKKQPGYYSIKLKGDDLSSGVYFCRLVASSGFTAVKKLILLK